MSNYEQIERFKNRPNYNNDRICNLLIRNATTEAEMEEAMLEVSNNQHNLGEVISNGNVIPKGATYRRQQDNNSNKPIENTNTKKDNSNRHNIKSFKEKELPGKVKKTQFYSNNLYEIISEKNYNHERVNLSYIKRGDKQLKPKKILKNIDLISRSEAEEESEDNITSRNKKIKEKTFKKKYPNLAKVQLDDIIKEGDDATDESDNMEDDEKNKYPALYNLIEKDNCINEKIPLEQSKYNINENPYNKIKKIKFCNPKSIEKSKSINDKQTNLMVAELTTQANINACNYSKNLLMRGKILKDEDHKQLKLNIRGIITKDNEKRIKKTIKSKKRISISEAIKIMNTTYIVGTLDILRIYREENTKLRLNEGVNIKRRFPKAIREIKDPP
jgi:hypothetical protein